MANDTADPDSVRARATVVRAYPPPAGLFGLRAPWWVSVVTDLGTGSILTRAAVRLDPDRWLLPGAEIQIVASRTPDPVHGFEIEWDSVPTIEQRVASADPVVVDPIRAAQTARRLRRGATPTYVDPVEDVYWRLTDQRALDSESLAFALQLLAEAGPPPPQWRRAVVVVSALRRVIQAGEPVPDAPAGTPQVVSFEPGSARGNQAVVSVHVPGRPAYAVLVEQFPHPPYKNVESCLPAVVSLDDPGRIQVLWDQVADTPDLATLMTEVAYQDSAG